MKKVKNVPIVISIISIINLLLIANYSLASCNYDNIFAIAKNVADKGYGKAIICQQSEDKKDFCADFTSFISNTVEPIIKKMVICAKTENGKIWIQNHKKEITEVTKSISAYTKEHTNAKNYISKKIAAEDKRILKAFNNETTYRNKAATSIEKLGQDHKRENILANRLSYLTQLKEIAWVQIEGNNVHIGFTKRPSDLRTIVNAAAFQGNKAIKFGVHVWAYPEQSKNSKNHYFCSATARYGKVQKSDCR